MRELTQVIRDSRVLLALEPEELGGKITVFAAQESLSKGDVSAG